MATIVKLPQWGMNMESGLLVKWLISEGDSVDKGQPLVEIETAKINSELESPESGIIAHIMVPEGETVESCGHNTRGKNKISFDEVLKKSLDLLK